jgi:hypothetical protein
MRIDGMDRENRNVLAAVCTMLGWYAAAIVATLVWIATRSDAEAPRSCVYWCLSPRGGATFAAVYLGVPGGVLGLLVSGFALAWFARWRAPTVVKGTAAAFAGMLLGPALILCVLKLGNT